MMVDIILNICSEGDCCIDGEKCCFLVGEKCLIMKNMDDDMKE